MTTRKKNDRPFMIHTLPENLISANLAEHTEIVKTLSMMWGHEELIKYVNDLLITERLSRQGFAPDIFVDLLKILQEHQACFPELYTPTIRWF